MKSKLFVLSLISVLTLLGVKGAELREKESCKYWNSNTKLIAWRPPMVTDRSVVTYEDLTGDGKPNIIRSFIADSIPIIWIDDDGNMADGDLEGDQVNDCLLVDLNRDGVFSGPGDLSVDWTDTDGDGVADIQLIVLNGSAKMQNFFDWNADYMYIIDFGEKDDIKNFIDWHELALRCWVHNGHSNFYTDYHGNTLFLKMHGSAYRIHDLRYSWENPFIFYDFDNDSLTEMTVRLLDEPLFRPTADKPHDKRFDKVNKEHDILYTKRITYAALSWDLDNDNGQSNEFDLDMSLRFTGSGFDYSDQVHKIKQLRGLPQADKLLYDPRWRQVEELIYPDQNSAYNLIFDRGEWNTCWFVFDEDDDCNRWERVEFYEPRSIAKVGMKGEGLDHNSQADAAGDRGEWDSDFSGKGNLYVAPFDGRIHLYGAEWGAWRIDPNANTYQGYGGLYPPIVHKRLAADPDSWATVRYEDSDNNGFFDIVEYDLDGDFEFETRVSLSELGIDDKATILETSKMGYNSFKELFARVTEQMWIRAEQAVAIAKMHGISANWYAFWQQPRTMHEGYEYGYWLNFYLYRDMRHVAMLNGNEQLVRELDKGYYGGDWSVVAPIKK